MRASVAVHAIPLDEVCVSLSVMREERSRWMARKAKRDGETSARLASSRRVARVECGMRRVKVGYVLIIFCWLSYIVLQVFHIYTQRQKKSSKTPNTDFISFSPSFYTMIYFTPIFTYFSFIVKGYKNIIGDWCFLCFMPIK